MLLNPKALNPEPDAIQKKGCYRQIPGHPRGELANPEKLAELIGEVRAILVQQVVPYGNEPCKDLGFRVYRG